MYIYTPWVHGLEMAAAPSLTSCHCWSLKVIQEIRWRRDFLPIGSVSCEWGIYHAFNYSTQLYAQLLSGRLSSAPNNRAVSELCASCYGFWGLLWVFLSVSCTPCITCQCPTISEVNLTMALKFRHCILYSNCFARITTAMLQLHFARFRWVAVAVLTFMVPLLQS